MENRPLCSSFYPHFQPSSTTKMLSLWRFVNLWPHARHYHLNPNFPKKLLFGFINFTTRKTPGTYPINSRSVALGTQGSTFYKSLKIKVSPLPLKHCLPVQAWNRFLNQVFLGKVLLSSFSNAWELFLQSWKSTILFTTLPTRAQ